jgi:CHAT domain-containing protein
MKRRNHSGLNTWGLCCAFLLILDPSSGDAQTWRELYTSADSMSSVTSGEVSPEAIVRAKAALSKVETEYGQIDTTVARVLDLVAELLESGWGSSVSSITSRLCKRRIIVDLLENGSGRPGEALTYALRALAIREKLLGPDHLDVARSLQLVASISFVLNKPRDGIPLMERALSIYEKAGATGDKDYAFALQNQAFLHYYQGNFAKAEGLYTRGVSLMRRILPSNDPDLSYPLTFLAVNYWSLGLYTEAEEPLKEALRNCQEVYGMESARTAIRLGNLSQHYEMQGNLTEAEIFGTRSHAMLCRVLRPDDPILGRARLGFGSFLKAQGKYSEAIDTLKKAIELLRATDPRTAWAIRLMGECHFALGNYAAAEKDYLQSLAVNPSISDDDTRCLDGAPLELARVFLRTGRFSAADSVLGPLVANRERVLDAENPSLAEALELYSEQHRLMGDFPGAMDLSSRAVDIRRKNFVRNARIMSESDAVLYAGHLRHSLDGYLSCFSDAQPADSSRIRQTAEIILSTKGQTTEQALLRRKDLVSETDSATIALAEEYRYLRYQMSAKYTEGPQRGNVAEFRRDLDSLSRGSNALESKLVRRSKSFSRTQSQQLISISDIASHLPPHSFLVEYVAYNYVVSKSGTINQRYLALIIGRESGARIVDLGEAVRIDEAIERYQQHFARLSRLMRPIGVKEEKEYKEIASDLFGLMWRPLEKYLGKGGSIFVAPDGGVNLVSFAGLMEDGKYLIEKYAVHYLSAGRDIVREDGGFFPGTGLMALGDPDFDASVAERISAGSRLAAISGRGNPYQGRNVRSGCVQLKELTVQRLNNTRTEVESIARFWGKQNVGESVEPLVGSKASEDLFKKESVGKRMIHLATHGYFVQADCVPGAKGGSVGGENPLLQSGLLLAGANLHGAGAREAGAEDGILTALEVSSLDLRGTDRVVLSACETGLGKVEQGEGVYGLRRAFQMAGARTVVSSLWQVPDLESMKFMKSLYSMKSQTYPELMQKVALQRISEARLRGRSTHPFTWGAFVATGEWRNRGKGAQN